MELTKLKGIGPSRAEEFNKLGIGSVEELLDHFPHSYKDLSTPHTEITVGEFVLLRAELQKVSTVTLKGRRLTKTTASFSGVIEFRAVWWNMPYVAQGLRTGEEYLVFGKAVSEKELVNPKVESVNNNVRLKGIVPIYKKTVGLNQNFIRDCMAHALDSQARPTFSLIEQDVMSIYRRVHFPSTVKEGIEAVARVKAWRLACYSVAHALSHGKVRRSFCPVDIEQYLARLPFRLTESQRAVIGEIEDDLISGKASRRIIVGDTGSGKSAVAYGAVYFMNTNGYSCAVMSPTEILARQHYEKLRELGFKVLLVTGSTMSAGLRCEIESGNYDVFSGTESLLNKHIEFQNLGLVVVDEQHRFGVTDRGALEQRYGCYSLSLSATPIPRTQMLGLFGLKTSRLEPLYQNENRRSYVISGSKLKDFWKYVQGKENSSVFCVCPRIEDEEGEEIYSAKKLFSEAQAQGLFGGKIALLHGGMSAAEKEKSMAEFASGRVRLLISTTVVEVGIDVPHANVMLVLNSDRFSIATLHQLRGRVGRDGGYSECYFHTDSQKDDTVERIRYVASVTSGAKLSEFDFERRGGGEVFGVRQSGKTSTYSPLEVELAGTYARRLIASEQALARFKEELFPGLVEALKDLTLS